MTKDEALRMALEALENNKQTHYYCEDTWYSCPQHEDGCANESVGDECTCGADKANAEIDQAITAIKEALANHIPDATKMVAQPEQELTNLERHERNVQRLFGTPQPKVEQTHNLAATVFVYQLKETGQIKCEYLDKAKDFEEDNAWEHLATLEPRMWIEYNYAKVSQPKVEQEPVANNAWKSGYDNCKAQSAWTLENVKQAWKSGYYAAKQENDCKRSHPHEEMSKECELRTEIARLTNKLAQRHWIGLDAEEIRKTDHHMVVGAYHYSFKQGARWAEEKLKERNT